MQIIFSEASSCIKCWQFLSTEMKETNSFAFVLLITISLGVMKPAFLLRRLPAYINYTNIYRLKHRGSLYQKRYGTLEKKKSLWHSVFAARYPESAQTICPLASANVFKERSPELTVYFAGNGCWSLSSRALWVTHFFSRVKNKVSKNMYASYGLLHCQHLSSPRPPTWYRRGLSSGCSKSQELQKAKLNKLENWNSKATKLSVPSLFPSVLVENKDSGGRALFPV